VGAERLTRTARVAALALGAAGCTAGDRRAAATRRAGVVARVNDGDTLTLASGAKVRLVQIDAPELTTRLLRARGASGARARSRPGTRVRSSATRGSTSATATAGRSATSSPPPERQRRAGAQGRRVTVFLPQRARQVRARAPRGRRACTLAQSGLLGGLPEAELNTGLGSITGRG
jgi:hypothetical protein